jgi:DNA-binding MarR family transcriptional regulator
VEEPRWLDEREMAAWLGFLEAGNRLMRLVEHQLKADSGLSHAQYEILIHLSGAPDGAVRMTELAERMVTSKSGLTYQVAQLEKAGLVKRRSCPTDDRGILAVVTDDGRRKLRSAAPGHVALVRACLIDLLTPDQRDTIAAAMSTVNDTLRLHFRI